MVKVELISSSPHVPYGVIVKANEKDVPELLASGLYKLANAPNKKTDVLVEETKTKLLKTPKKEKKAVEDGVRR